MPLQQWSDSILIAELNDEPMFSEEFESLMRQLEEKDKATPDVIVDLKRVTYLNSSNIAKLLKLGKKLLTNRGKMVICGISTNVWGLFLVTGLDKVFEFSDSVATGLAGVQLSTDK